MIFLSWSKWKNNCSTKLWKIIWNRCDRVLHNDIKWVFNYYQQKLTFHGIVNAIEFYRYLKNTYPSFIWLGCIDTNCRRYFRKKLYHWIEFKQKFNNQAFENHFGSYYYLSRIRYNLKTETIVKHVWLNWMSVKMGKKSI